MIAARNPDPAPAPRRASLWRAAALVRSLVLTAFAVLGACAIAAFGVALLLGLRPVTVISGSMEPTLPVGSVLFTRTVPVEDVEVGDVVTVERPRDLGLVTHRVVAVEDADQGRSLTLRGDANSVDDPQPYVVSEVGSYVWHVGWLGHLTLLLQSGRGILLVSAVVLFLVAVQLLDPDRLRAAVEPEPSHRGEPGDRLIRGDASVGGPPPASGATAPRLGEPY